VIAS
jgi:excisionase family DNA binding protein